MIPHTNQIIFTLNLPNMFSHCQKCGAVLLINEEWHTGRCIECKQWAEFDWSTLTQEDDEPATGAIARPNRDS